MILTTASQRLVLWGGVREGNLIKAELVYFDSYLTASATLQTLKGQPQYAVTLPDDIQNQDIPGTAIGATFVITGELAPTDEYTKLI